MKAVIVGGGIGGLTAALALRRRGWRVEVLERAARLEPVGAGLQISPNGYRVLAALGLGDAVRAVAYEPQAIQMRMGRSGRKLFDIPLGSESGRRWGAPYLQVHRADLIDALRAALPETAVRLGTEVEGYEQSEGAVAAAVSGGGAVDADLLIAADGVRSAIRERMLGAERARFTRCVAWRAVVPRERLAGFDAPPGACIWAGEARHAVTYPLRRGELVNFVGIVEADDWRGESWTEPGDRAELARIFEGWSPLIGAIIAEAETLNRWALFDRPPLARWSDGRVALLGDACHPMAPSLAQGACQAMEDAWVLAECVADGASPEALRRYEFRRKARASRVQREAAANVRRFHRRGALAQALGYAPIWMMGALAPGFFHRRMDWLYGEDVTRG